MATETLKPTDEPEGLLGPGQTYTTISDTIGDAVIKRPVDRQWLFGFAVAFIILQLLMMTITNLLFIGIGLWGVNIPHAWAYGIINFVWWIGIGHAGTLISAILLLLHQRWRNSINRFAEAMTIFAVLCAGMYPLFHTGRPWYAFWLLPLPNSMDLWPQFRSPLIWDVFAVSTYLTVSLLFWLVGLVPDFANLRDRATNPVVKTIFGVLSLGWRGSAKHWQRYESAYVILAGLSTPLVLSVHTIVSFDFAVANLPGWHTTVFPPYFVAGAIYSGFAMVLVLVIPVRTWYGMENLITIKHMDVMARVMLATGLMVIYGYSQEAFMAWYSGELFEQSMFYNRVWGGPFWWAYWLLLLCNFLIPQLLWIGYFRRNLFWLFLIALVINTGMWLERYVILMTLSRDYMPSAWGQFTATVWDWAMFAGTIGFFFFGMLLFIRLVPMISIFEVQLLLPGSVPHHQPAEHHDPYSMPDAEGNLHEKKKPGGQGGGH